MAGYVKVFQTITSSSLWGMDHKVIRVFIYMLANCDSVGILEGAAPELAHRCHISLAEWDEVLGLLMAPDPHSRTPDNEGRRVASVPGGWKILNYHLYRTKGQGKEGSRAPYMRDYRAAKRGEEPDGDAPREPEPVPPEGPEGCNTLQRGVTRGTDADADASVHPTGVSPAAPAAPRKPKVEHEPLRQEVLAHWRSVAVPAGLPDVLKEGDRLRKALDARLKDPEWLGHFREAVCYAALSPDGAWMRGLGDRNWRVSLDWLLKPEKAEGIAAKARATGGRASAGPSGRRSMAADATTAAQVQRLPVRKLASAGAP
jgi:hypothetical protein